MTDEKELLSIVNELGFTWQTYDIFDIELLNRDELGYLSWLPKEIFQIILDYLRYDRKFLNVGFQTYRIETIFNDNSDKYWLIQYGEITYLCRRLMQTSIMHRIEYIFNAIRIDDLFNSVRMTISTRNGLVLYSNNTHIIPYINMVNIYILDEIPTQTKLGKLIHEQIVKILC